MENQISGYWHGCCLVCNPYMKNLPEIKPRSEMRTDEIAADMSPSELTTALHYLAELVEATDTIATRYNGKLPICHPLAKAFVISMGLLPESVESLSKFTEEDYCSSCKILRSQCECWDSINQVS